MGGATGKINVLNAHSSCELQSTCWCPGEAECFVGATSFSLTVLGGHMRTPFGRGGWCTLSGLMCSMRRSRAGIQLGARWQFWKKTHLPLSMELSIMASARGPCGGRSAKWLGPAGPAPPSPSWPHSYLALAQGDGRKLLGELHLLSKLVQVGSGVSAR